MTVPIKFALGVGAAGAAGILAVSEATPEMTPFANSGQVIIALLVVANGALMLWRDFVAKRREEQQRQWLKEDREEAKRVMERSAADVKLDLHKASSETARLLAVQNAVVKDEMAKNTALTEEVGKKADAAYHEANTVNQKIAAVGNVRRADPGAERRRDVDPVKP